MLSRQEELTMDTLNLPATPVLRTIAKRPAVIGGLHGSVSIEFETLVGLFGKPTPVTYGDRKVDVEWIVETPAGVAWVYNWKNGRAYLGPEGTPITQITDWNVGGQNRRAASYVMSAMYAAIAEAA
jgi:hypothetical protein